MVLVIFLKFLFMFVFWICLVIKYVWVGILIYLSGFCKWGYFCFIGIIE